MSFLRGLRRVSTVACKRTNSLMSASLRPSLQQVFAAPNRSFTTDTQSHATEGVSEDMDISHAFDDLVSDEGMTKIAPNADELRKTLKEASDASTESEGVALPWETEGDDSCFEAHSTERLWDDDNYIQKSVTREIMAATHFTEVRDAVETHKEHMNLFSYNAAIKQLGRYRKWKLAIATFNQAMRRCDELHFDDSDKVSLNRTLLAVLVRCDLMTVAMGIFQKFLDSNLKPDGELIGLLLRGCRNGAQHSDNRAIADHLFKLLMTEYSADIAPNAVNFVCLITTHARAGDIEKAFQIYSYVMQQKWSEEVLFESGERYTLPSMTAAEYVTSAMLGLCSVRNANADGCKIAAEIESLAAERLLRLSTVAKNSILMAFLAQGRSEEMLVKYKSLFHDWDAAANAAWRGCDEEQREQLSAANLHSLACSKSALLQLMHRPQSLSDENMMQKWLKKVEAIHEKMHSEFADQMTERFVRKEARKLLSAQLLTRCNDWQKVIGSLHEFDKEYGVELFRQYRDEWFLDVHLHSGLEARAILRDAFSDENALERMKECFGEGKEETTVRIWTGAGSMSKEAVDGVSAMKRTVIEELQSWNPPLKAEPCSDWDTAVAVDPQHFELFLESLQSGETDRDSFCPKQLPVDFQETSP